MEDIIFKDDIEFKNGDFRVDDADGQHIEHIIRAKPGHFFQHPTIGVGADDFINGNESKPSIRQRIKQNLIFDNYRVNKILVEGIVDELITSIDALRLK